MTTTQASSSHSEDSFLKSIRALKSFLSPTESPSPPEDLERTNKALTYKLEDALKDATRERTLRVSLEKAFADLTDNRNQLKQYLDDILDPSSTTTRSEAEQRASAETRILAAEAERIEAIRLQEHTQLTLNTTQAQLTKAERTIQRLEAALAEAKKTHKTQQDHASATIASLQATQADLEKSLQAAQSKQSATDSTLQMAKQALLTTQDAKSTLEKTLAQTKQEHAAALTAVQEEKAALAKLLETTQQEKRTIEQLVGNSMMKYLFGRSKLSSRHSRQFIRF